MLKIRMLSDIEVTVVDYEMDVLRLICGRAPQSRISLKEKQSFYDELKGESDMLSAGDLIMCLLDFNGHVCRHIDGIDGVHGGYGVGQRNLEGIILLEVFLEKEF